MRGGIVCSLLFSLLASCLAQELERLELPEAAETLSAVSDGTTLYLVYAREGRVFFRGYTEEAGFGEAVQVLEGGPEVSLAGQERRPQIAVDEEGRLFVVWQDRDVLVVARSEDGGMSWQQVDARDRGAEGGVDMPVIASGPDGTVALAWVDTRSEGRSDDPLALDIFVSLVDSKGRFGKNRVATEGMPGVCPCCMPGMAIDGDGVLWIGYRSTVGGVKETQLVRSKNGKRFENAQVSRDSWAYQGCPMSGPVLSVSEDGERLIVAWTKQEEMYLATTDNGGKDFSAPERLGSGRFRAASRLNEDGSLILLWSEGRQTGYRRLGDEEEAGRLELRPEGCLILHGEALYLLQSP